MPKQLITIIAVFWMHSAQVLGAAPGTPHSPVASPYPASVSPAILKPTTTSTTANSSTQAPAVSQKQLGQRFSTPNSPTTQTKSSTPQRRTLRTTPKSKKQSKSNSLERFAGLTGKPLTTVLGGLSIALGAFFLLAWAFKKGMPKGSGRLPTDVIEVLGKSTLSPKQTVHLVRLGNKLLLISFAPAGAETLAEITDPEEVTRLTALCNTNGQGSTEAFRQAFEQIGRTKTKGFLGNEVKHATQIS